MEITSAQHWNLAELFATKIAGYTRGNHGEYFDRSGNYAGRGDSMFKFIEKFDEIAPYLMEWHDTSMPGPRGAVLISVSNCMSLGCKTWEVELMDGTNNKSYRRGGTVLAAVVALCLLDTNGIETGIVK